MEGIAIAIIGTLGVVLPALLALGSAHVRRLHRIRQELETYAVLPPEFAAERQLTRYLINESLWEYAVARRRLVATWPWVIVAILSSLAAGFGWSTLQHNRLDAFFETNDDPGQAYRLLGAGILLFSVGFYFHALTAPMRAARQRVRRLDGPPARIRQLIAIEAQRLDDRDLSTIRIGTSAALATKGSPVSWLRAKLWGDTWEQLDRLAVASASTSKAEQDDLE